MRPSRAGLAVVLATATALRYWDLGHGIPYALNVEEPEIVERALRMMKGGTLNPQFFDYGQLHIFIQLIVSIARFIVGSVTGAWSSLAEATSGSFYFWGRVVTAGFGVSTVFLAFRIGLRWGARHALLAAALLAVMPLHVQFSHYVLIDTPLTFFVTLTMVLALGAHERPAVRAFAMAGAAAGFAAAVKYNGVVALLMPLIACFMTPAARPSRRACGLAATGAAAAAFLLAAPFTLLDLPGFLDRFAALTAEYRQAAPPGDAGAVLYLGQLRQEFAWPGVLVIAGGLVMGLVRAVRGPGRVPWAVALAFPLPYFVIISERHIIQARYLLPLVPMLCVLAAAAVISGVSLLRRYQFPRGVRTALIAGLTLALLAPPAVASIAFNRMISRTSTVDLAYAWIEGHIAAGSTVVLEGGHLTLPAAYRQSRIGQLRHQSYESYVAQGATYLVASSECYGPYLRAPAEFSREYADYVKLFSEAEELARFTPDAGRPGPELRILKVRR